MSEYRPLVSIIMNCFNGATYLTEAINSVVLQTYEEWELIFWDNQSTDDSSEICMSYKDSRIHYFKSNQHTNLGLARANALEQTKGGLVAFLDTDDLWMPNKLEMQVPLFQSPDVGIVISDTIFFNMQGKEKKLYGNKLPPQGRVFIELMTRYFVSLETVVLRKSAIAELDHSFDPNLSHISDFDLIARLSHDWSLSCLPMVLAKWRVHSGSGSWQEPEKFISEKIYFVQKMDLLNPAPDSEWQKARPAFTRTLDFSLAVTNLKEGNKAICRDFLKKHVFQDYKSCFLYAISFVPTAAYWLETYNKWKNVVSV